MGFNGSFPGKDEVAKMLLDALRQDKKDVTINADIQAEIDQKSFKTAEKQLDNLTKTRKVSVDTSKAEQKIKNLLEPLRKVSKEIKTLGSSGADFNVAHNTIKRYEQLKNAVSEATQFIDENNQELIEARRIIGTVETAIKNLDITVEKATKKRRSRQSKRSIDDIKSQTNAIESQASVVENAAGAMADYKQIVDDTSKNLQKQIDIQKEHTDGVHKAIKAQQELNKAQEKQLKLTRKKGDDGRTIPQTYTAANGLYEIEKGTVGWNLYERDSKGFYEFITAYETLNDLRKDSTLIAAQEAQAQKSAADVITDSQKNIEQELITLSNAYDEMSYRAGRSAKFAEQYTAVFAEVKSGALSASDAIKKLNKSIDGMSGKNMPNMSTVIKRYNEIMTKAGADHRTIGTRFSQDTDGWGLEEMIEEAKYWLSTYYEADHANAQMRYGDEYERKAWRSETGKFERFIKAYEQYVSSVKTTTAEVEKQNDVLNEQENIIKAINRLHGLERDAYSIKDEQEVNRIYQERLSILKEIGEEKLKSYSEEEYERANNVNWYYKNRLDGFDELRDITIYDQLDDQHYYDGDLMQDSKELEVLLETRLNLLGKINDKETESYREQIEQNEAIRERISLMKQLEPIYESGKISQQDLYDLVNERGTLDDRRSFLAAIQGDISRDHADDSSWDDLLDEAQLYLDTYEKILVTTASGKKLEIGPNMSMEDYRSFLRIDAESVKSVEFIRKEIEQAVVEQDELNKKMQQGKNLGTTKSSYNMESLIQLTDNYGKSLDEVNNKLMQGTKLLDKQGQILRLFHNSRNIFDAFDPKMAGFGQGQALGLGNYLALRHNGEFNDMDYGRYQTQWYANVQNIFKARDKITDDQAASIIDKFMAKRADGFKEHMLSKLLDHDVIDAIKDIAEIAGTTAGEIFKHIGYDAVMDGAQINVFDPSKLHRANSSVLDIGTDDFNALRELEGKVWHERRLIEKANDQIQDLANEYSGKSKEDLEFELLMHTLSKGWRWHKQVAKIGSAYKELTGELPKSENISEESMRALVEDYEFSKQAIQGYQEDVAKHEKILADLLPQLDAQRAKIESITSSYLTGDINGIVNKDSAKTFDTANGQLAFIEGVEESVKTENELQEEIKETNYLLEGQISLEEQLANAAKNANQQLSKQENLSKIVSRDIINKALNGINPEGFLSGYGLQGDNLTHGVDLLKDLVGASYLGSSSPKSVDDIFTELYEFVTENAQHTEKVIKVMDGFREYMHKTQIKIPENMEQSFAEEFTDEWKNIKKLYAIGGNSANKKKLITRSKYASTPDVLIEELLQNNLGDILDREMMQNYNGNQYDALRILLDAIQRAKAEFGSNTRTVFGLGDEESVDFVVKMSGIISTVEKNIAEMRSNIEGASIATEKQVDAERQLAAASQDAADAKKKQGAAAHDTVSAEDIIARDMADALEKLRSSNNNETTLFSLKGVFEGEDLVNQAQQMVENIAEQANLNVSLFNVKDDTIKVKLYNDELKVTVDQMYKLRAATEDTASATLELVSQSFTQNVKALNENTFDTEGVQQRALASIEKVRASLHGLEYDLTELEDAAKSISSNDDFVKFNNKLKAAQDNIQAIKNSTVSKNSMNPLANMQRDMQNANIEIETMRLKLEKFGDIQGVAEAKRMLEEMAGAVKQYNEATDAQGQQGAYNQYSNLRSSFKAQSEYINAAKSLNDSQESAAKQADPIKSQYREILNLINQINTANERMISLQKTDGGTGILSGKIAEEQAKKLEAVEKLNSAMENIETTGILGSDKYTLPDDVKSIGTDYSQIAAFINDVGVQSSLTTAEIEKLVNALVKAGDIDLSMLDAALGSGSTKERIKQTAYENKYFSDKTRAFVDSDGNTNLNIEDIQKLGTAGNTAKEKLEGLAQAIAQNADGAVALTKNFTMGADGITKLDFSILDTSTGAIKDYTAALGTATGQMGVFDTTVDKSQKNMQAMRTQMESIQGVIGRLGLVGVNVDAGNAPGQVSELLRIYQELTAQMSNGDKADNSIVADLIKKSKIATSEVEKLYTQMLQMESAIASGRMNSEGVGDPTGDIYGQLVQKAQEYAQVQPGATLQLGRFNEGTNTLNASMVYTNGVIEEFQFKMDSLSGQMGRQQVGVGKLTNSWDMFKTTLGQAGKRLMTALVGYNVFYKAISEVRKGIGYVKEIDLALTELKKVTDEAEESYAKFLKTASGTAGEIGSTISEFTEASANFARLGYTIEESADMAKTAIIYKNVADGLDTVDDATDSIISTMKAFGIESDNTMGIIDRFNEVGNNFAITSAGIGEALQRSASALYAGGNTIDESIALVTAANSVVQNPEQVGTALKTLTLRLRGAKVELEEAGLETANMAESTSTLQAKLKALTHGKVDIMADANTFKNTTQILREMSAAWEDMTDIERASALELMGGKRQANILSSVITNFETVEEVIETSMNSSGSAMEENAKWLDSIEGKSTQLANSMQTIWNNTLNSDVIKWFYDLAIGASKVVESVGLLPTVLAGVLIYFKAFKGMSIGSIFKDFGAGVKNYAVAMQQVSQVQSLNLGMTSGGMLGTNAINAYSQALAGLSAKQQAAILTSAGLEKAHIAQVLAQQGVEDATIRQLVGLEALNTAKQASSAITAQEAASLWANGQLKLSDAAATWLVDEATGELTRSKVLEAATMLMSKGATEQDIVALLGLAGASNTASVGVKGLTASLLSMQASNIIGWIMALAAVVVTVISSVSSKTEKLEEALNDLNSDISSLKSEIDSLNSELETTRDRMEELLSMGSLSFTEQEELENLKLQNAELERQLKLQEALLKNKEAEQKEKAKDVINAKWEGKYADKAYWVSANGTIGEDEWWTTGVSGKEALDTSVPKYQALKEENDVYKQAYLDVLTAQQNNKSIGVDEFRHLLVAHYKANGELREAENFSKKTDEEIQKLLERYESGGLDWYNGGIDAILANAKKLIDLNDSKLGYMESGINLVLGDMSKVIDGNGLSYSMNDDEVNKILDEYYAYSLKFSNAQGAASKSSVISAIWDNTESDAMAQLKTELDEIADSGDNRATKEQKAQKLIQDALDDTTNKYERLETFMGTVGITAEEMANYFVAASEAPDIKTIEGVTEVYKDGIDILKKYKDERDAILGKDENGQDITWSNLFTQDKDGKMVADKLKVSAILEGADEAIRNQFVKIIESVENGEATVDQALAKWSMSGFDKTFDILNSEFEELNNEMFAGIADDISGLIDTVGELKAAFEDVANSMDLVATAQKQMNSSGRISVKTALDLIESTENWDQILTVTNGTIKLATDAEEILAQAKLNSIKAQLEYAYQMAESRYQTALTAQGELDYADNSGIVMTAESVKAEAIGRVSAVVVALGAAVDALIAKKYGEVLSTFENTYTSATKTVVSQSNSMKTTIDKLQKDRDEKKKLYEMVSTVDDYDSFKNYYDYDETPGDKYTDDSGDATELDWLDHYLTDIENKIEENQARLENIVMDTDYLEGDNTIFDQIIDLYDEKSKKMQDALATYNSRADYLFGKLPGWVKTAINNGSLDISSIADEDLVANIEEYYEYVDAASNLTVELENLKQEIADIAKQKFDNIVEAYENMLNLGGFRDDSKFDFDGSQAYVDSLQKQIDLAEASGEEVGTAYYQAMIDSYSSEGGYIDILEAQKTAMQDALDDAVRNNQITVGSEQWYEMVNAIYDVDGAIIDAKISLEEWQTSINDMNSESFDDLISKIDHLASEIDFLYGLLSDDDKIVDEFGNWTGEGIAALGLMAQEMERAKKEAELYGKEIDALSVAYADGKYSQEEYEEKLKELKEGQWSAIEAAESAKDAIIDLNKARVESAKKVIQDEIDAYSELIEKRREELDVEKDAYDFQKKVQESQKSISDIQRRLAALANDNSASANAKRRKLQAELNQSLADLEEIYYEESIRNQQDALDKEIEDYEEARQDEMDALDEYLKNVEQVVQDSLTAVIANADTALETLNTYATEHGFTLSEELKNPWVKAAEEATAFKNSATGELGELIDAEGILQTWKIDATDDLVAPWTSGEDAINKFSSHVTTALSTLRGELDTAATNASTKAQQIISDMKSAMSEITKAQNAANNATYTPNVGGNSNVGSSSTSGSGGGYTGGVGGATSSDPNVVALQKFLNNYFNANLSVDGIYGSLTKAAVKKMQKTIGSVDDGLYGSETKKKLDEYFSNLLKLTNKEVAMGGDVSQYKEYYKNAKKAIPLACYAKGTTGVKKDQFAIIDELGDELVMHANNGRLAFLTKGSAVIPHDISENIMQLGRLDPSTILDQNKPSIGVHPEIHNTEINIDITYGDMVSIGEYNGGDIKDLEKMVAKQFDKHTKDLNSALRKYVR